MRAALMKYRLYMLRIQNTTGIPAGRMPRLLYYKMK